LGKDKSEVLNNAIFIGRTEEADLVYQENVILNVNHTESVNWFLKDTKEGLARYLIRTFFLIFRQLGY